MGAVPLTGLLLAGGAGHRMGTDKADLIVRGERLGRRVARVLEDACDEILVASGDGARLAWLGQPQVADAEPGLGPLAGILAGLEAAQHPLVAVVAVDMPFASAAVLRLLAGLWDGEHGVVPVTERGPEPLHAVYARSAAAAVRDLLGAGRRSMREALDALEVRLVERDVWGAADPTGGFAVNLNRPGDLRALRQAGGSAGEGAR
jgi:molybdopterin-guanine dinucleotide biosynthesis protein A